MWGVLYDERRVFRLQLLLALASTVILGSESRGTRDHILLSQNRDFPFRRLLRLAGSRWRYSIRRNCTAFHNCQAALLEITASKGSTTVFHESVLGDAFLFSNLLLGNNSFVAIVLAGK
jgi:hypothetical protein